MDLPIDPTVSLGMPLVYDDEIMDWRPAVEEDCCQARDLPPEGAELPDTSAVDPFAGGLLGPCATSPTAAGSVLFVDPAKGSDSNPGTFLQPLASLDAPTIVGLFESGNVLPGLTLYLKRGEVFDHSSIPINTQRSALHITASGTASDPIRVVAYGRGDPPIIQGGLGTSADTTRMGIYIADACHVRIEGIQVEGFGVGIRVRWGCRSIVVSNCVIQKQGNHGIAFGTQTACVQLCGCYEVLGSHYPADCRVEDSTFVANGHSGEQAHISLGRCTSNITIRGNSFKGLLTVLKPAWPRGRLGIYAGASSSGHLIERNVFTGLVAALGGQPGVQGSSILLDTVAPHTPASGALTVIRRNRIYDNAGHGIIVRGGTQGVHIHSNLISNNGTGKWSADIDPQRESLAGHGILIQAGRVLYDDISPGDMDWDEAFQTSDISIYRNLIFENEMCGVLVDAGDGFRRVEPENSYTCANLGPTSSCRVDSPGEYYGGAISDIAIVNNTIDDNGRAGVMISRTADADLSLVDADGDGAPSLRIRDVAIVANILSWNGSYWGSDHDYANLQVVTEGMTASTSSWPPGETQSWEVDHNLYWATAAPVDGSGEIYVWWWYLGYQRTVSDLQGPGARFERYWTGGRRPRNPGDPYFWNATIGDRGLSPGTTSSAAGQGTWNTGFIHENTGVDIGQSEDYLNRVAWGRPEVGALELEDDIFEPQG